MKTTYKIVDLKQGEGGRPHTIYGSLYEGDTFICRDDLMTLGDVLDHAAHHAEVNGLDVDECIRERLQGETVSPIPIYGASPIMVSAGPAYGAPPIEGFPFEVETVIPKESANMDLLKTLRDMGFPMAEILNIKGQLKTGDAVIKKTIVRDWEDFDDYRLGVPYSWTYLVFRFTYLGTPYSLNYHDLPRFVRERSR